MQPTAMMAAPTYFGGNIHHHQEKIFPWEQEALEVLKVYKPKCIVLDLDFTLWPTFYSAHTLPPYIPLNDHPSQVLCVDKKTHKPRLLSLYPEVQRTIEFCFENDIMVSIASKNSNRKDAQAILRSLGIWHRLHFPQIFHSRKTYHFRNLKSVTKFNYEEFMFFDDDVKNVTVCKNIGVQSFRVDRANGFHGKLLLQALKTCAERAKVGCQMKERGGEGEGELEEEEEEEEESDGVMMPILLPSLSQKVSSTSSSSSTESSDSDDVYCMDVESIGMFI